MRKLFVMTIKTSDPSQSRRLKIGTHGPIYNTKWVVDLLLSPYIKSLLA